MTKVRTQTTIIQCDFVGRPHSYKELLQMGYTIDEITETQIDAKTYEIRASKEI